MKDFTTAFRYDFADLNRNAWMARVEDTAEDFGYVVPIGLDHKALWIDAGRTLLVTFESVANIRKSNDDNAPLGWGFVKSHGWSSLTLLADAEVDWFRSPEIYGYFDRLIDDGFFDDFDRILFYGAGAAGYAAAAFSVAAPESNVLAIQPQATLDTVRVPWDRRFDKARRLDFTSRFGFAPMMVETATDVTIIHDPTVIEDAVHASMFDGDNTHHLTTPYLGPQAARGLQAMDILPEVIEQAMSGTLTRAGFAQMWRARRDYMPYLRTLMYRLDGEDHHERLLARLCRQVSTGGNRPLFAERLEELKASGVTL